MVDASNINAFERQLDNIRQTTVGFFTNESAKPSASRDDWLTCETTQEVRYNKVIN